MTKEKFTEFDFSEHLENDDMIIELLNDALEHEDPRYFISLLGDISKAKGMTNIAKETGLGRESLYKALSGSTSPKFETILKILNSMDVKFKIAS